jgi:hypothetical protein
MINGMLGPPWCAVPVDWQGAVRSLVFLALIPSLSCSSCVGMVNRRMHGLVYEHEVDPARVARFEEVLWT